MIKKDYKFMGNLNNMVGFRELLNFNFLTYTPVFFSHDYRDDNSELILSFNISPDFISEVDELVKECAEKTGVKVV